VLGYVCVGPAPLTEGTYDLYWIAVDPDTQGRGVGRALLTSAEGEVERRLGRLLLIETSSQDVYQSTVRFYERCGYALLAQIAEYYRPGDDKLVFGKYLPAGRHQPPASKQ
jgi:ribosomal protein S18 acetylase RimI-like enzyme